jgi:integrase
LRGILKAARDLDQMTDADYSKAVSIKAVKGETLPRGRALSKGEISGLLDACRRDPSPAGARDAALIALAYGCGLRRAEIASLQLDDYDDQAATLRVLGKRNKERSLPITKGAADALADWIHVRGLEPGALFYPIAKGGKIEHRTVNPQVIYDALAKRAGEAGIKQLSPHDFRRTFVSDLLDQGADISTVQQLAGHANPQTTARYDRRGEATKRKAVELLHIPYTKRQPS